MTRKIFRIALVLACLVGVKTARAEFKDIRIDLTNAAYLTAEEGVQNEKLSMGFVIADDGTPSRVAADDAAANIVLSGKFHSNEHGWGNFSSTVAVEGPVKISMGTCAWGGDVTVKNGSETVGSFNTNTGVCYHNDKTANIASFIYKGGAATLTVSGGSYTPYFAVEAVDPSELVEDATVTYSLGEYADAGIVPAPEKVEIGKTIITPPNYTVYQEGKTLVGWSDGSRTYEIGEVVTVSGDMTLTPVFVNNTVSLADRTEPVTIKWDFQRQNGAPTVGFQNVTGFWVAQAKIGTETIDVQLPFDTNNGGKIANANWNDWAQMNEGTTFTVPSCNGAVISLESYSATESTVDGQPMTVNGGNASFTCAGKAESVPLVISKAGSYYRYIQVVLPVVKSSAGATFDNTEASVVWAFNSADYEKEVTATPDNGFAMKAFDMGVCAYKGLGSTTMCPDITFVRINSTKGESDVVTWSLKPAKGLEFTPTSISFYIARNGTDGAENAVSVTGAVPGGQSVTFSTITPHRNNKTQSADKFGSSASYTTKYEYTLTVAQQEALTSGEGFNLVLNNGYGTTKDCMYSDVRINGILNGTTQEVTMYPFSASANIAAAGNVTVYPKADEYEAGTAVKLTAEKNFGYAFVNWTDAAGKVVSAEPSFSYTVDAAAELTANFKAINTYELAYTVSGGANDYQVQLSPAPVAVDGRNMYEEGTTVTLTAVSNPIVKFTNWADGQSASEITVTMDSDHTDIVANYDAVDYIVGWDFMQSGNNGRAADFAAAENDAVALVMRNADGDIQGWLDKSEFGAGGYEGRPAAVNWRTSGLGDYYWQTMVNAEAFTDLQIITAMTFNYNAYTKQNVEYSLDGENWKSLGTITIEGAKKWTDATFSFPAEANNQKALYIRWIADKTSDVGGSKSDNDGIALGASYIVGTAKLIDDGTAPVLVSQVPAEGSETASINGKIVLTFDEKVKVKEGVTASLGDLSLTPTVTGKTVMFEYKNLTYATAYKFSLAAGSVMDLTDNAMDKAITISFTTKTRPVVAKGGYDAEVSNVDELLAAIEAAGKRDDKTKRFRIFLHDGNYKLPASTTATKTGSDGKSYPDPTTYITTPNLSFIGESRDGVVITNTVPDVEGDNGFGAANVLEGIGKGDVIQLSKTATGTYMQHLTIKSAMGDSRGRDIELNDQSDKTICKDVCLWGYQDTYVSNNENSRFYFEGGVLRGRTDFLCGKGDVYYNGVILQMCADGGYIAVPSKPKQYGYIFKDCEIVGEKSGIDGKYTLGRPWGSGTPIALFIDTKMTVKPSAAGWNEMSGGWPARFAEYNSTTASGTVIDLKDRKKIFADTHANNPVLTQEEADFHSYSRVMGGDDDWDPASIAEQAPAPSNVTIDGNTLTWDDNDYVLCWAVCKNGKVIGFTTEPSYTVEPEVGARTAAVYSVRASNEMGGLGEAVEASSQTAIDNIYSDAEVVSTVYYNLQGMRVAPNTPGVLVKVDTLASGETVTTKVIVK